MSIAKKPTRERVLHPETAEAARRDRAGRKVTSVAMRFPTALLDQVDEACEAELATVSRNTYLIRAIQAKVEHDEKAARVKVPREHDGPMSNFTLRLPTVLNNRLERALKHLTYQDAKTSRNSYIVGAVEEQLERSKP